MDSKYINLLKKTTLFNGFSDKEIADAIYILNGVIKNYQKNETIIKYYEPVNYLSIVLSGSITGRFINEMYDELNMANMGPGEIFGESLALLKFESPVEVISNTNSEILMLDINKIDSDSLSNKILKNLLLSLAKKNYFLNNKVRLYSQKKIRDKVRLYLIQKSEGKNIVNLDISKTDLAKLINVDRSSLERELSKMENENIIKFEKRKVILLNKNFFYIN